MNLSLQITIVLSLFVGGCFEHRRPKKVKENKNAPTTPNDSSKPKKDGGDPYKDYGNDNSYGDYQATSVPNNQQLPTPTSTALAGANTPAPLNTPVPGSISPGAVQMSFTLVSDSTTPWQDRVKITWIHANGVKTQPPPMYKLNFKSEKTPKNSVNYTPAIEVSFFMEGRSKPCHVKYGVITDTPKPINAVCE